MGNTRTRIARAACAAATTALLVLGVAPAAAQTEGDLRSALEGKEVRLRIDMPASQDGVNVHPHRKPPIDFNDHVRDLKRQGIALRRGATCRVTLVKAKDKHIEFQLDGGGPSLRDRPHYSPAGPSPREVELSLKAERTEAEARELAALRRRREAEERRLQDEHKSATDAWKASGGSRFNLRYETKLTPAELTVESVRAALADVVDFDLSGASGGPSPASGAALEQEKLTKPLVVMIKGKLGDEDTIGAGIIFGTGNDRLYIVTANHVVRRGGKEVEALQVQFHWLPGEWNEAKLLTTADPELDVAVVSVPNLQQIALPLLQFKRVGAEPLKPKQQVYFVGYGSAQAWHTRQAPDPIASVSAEAIRFQSAFLTPGDSGGVLVSDGWRIIGMIRSDQPPEGDALNMLRILEKLKEWNYPVTLGY